MIITLFESKNGHMLLDQEQIETEVIKHYERVWTTREIPLLRAKEALILFSKVNPPSEDCIQALNDKLSNRFLPEEMIKYLYQMENGKTPGLDGFLAEFYKEIKLEMIPILAQICTEIQTIGYLHPTINAIMVSLIPKILNPSTLKYWRPISLCNFSYKLMAKVLAIQMSSFMNELIDDSQYSFVKGRKIKYSMTMVIEFLHTERTQNKVMMILKEDTSKAYDMLEWEYLLSMLCLKGISVQNLKWFVAVLKTTNMAILFNGRLMQSFPISRGIRQDFFQILLIPKDTLFSYLRVLVGVQKLKSEDWMPFLERIQVNCLNGLIDVTGEKRCWDFLQEGQRKWKEVLLRKYFFDMPIEDLLRGNQPRRSRSDAWKIIAKHWEEVAGRTFPSLGHEGRKIEFWSDRWARPDHIPFSQRLEFWRLRELCVALGYTKVEDFFDFDKNKWKSISTLVVDDNGFVDYQILRATDKLNEELSQIDLRIGDTKLAKDEGLRYGSKAYAFESRRFYENIHERMINLE
eukprot:Gb_34966 [translate_table: standard]